MNDILIDIATLAQKIGTNPAYTQGGGGNISQKVQDEMYIKASGFRLDTLTPNTGFVQVNHHSFRNFYGDTATNSLPKKLLVEQDANVTKDATAVGQETRPSIETGFHALLGPTVLHTHSVWANLLTCTMEGNELIEILFPEAHIIPYHTPGAPLSRAIYAAQKHKQGVNVLFLQNHGVIVYGDSAKEVEQLHENLNKNIRHYLKLNDTYPTCALKTEPNQTYTSTELTDFVQKHIKRVITLNEHTLFPDQVVYTKDDRFNIDVKTGRITCHASEKEARAYVETIAAWFYLIDTITALNLTARYLPQSETDYIANMESEKYRKNILQI